MLKPFKKLQTKWEGLWYNDMSRTYISPVLDMSVLKQFKGKVRFVVRKNKLYEKGSNRPNMQIMVCDSQSEADGQQMEIEEKEEYILLEDALNIARGILDDASYGYSCYDDLIVEVERFMRDKAVEL